MYIHSHLRTSKDIITFVYCTYKHMLQWPGRFKDTYFFTMLNTNTHVRNVVLVHVIIRTEITSDTP